ncbi:MAG: alcohol dehydrogenase catalytic domain-containing protein, partial [Phycisphaerales bacterium]|nr:alcohol dehydrogenase catalytic domain-containing protein [Phycisphaerales bacterium]
MTTSATSKGVGAATTASHVASTMPATMRALYKHHAGPELRLDATRAVPTPGPRDVLIKVAKAGICGTDRHIWEWDAWAASRIPVGI